MRPYRPKLIVTIRREFACEVEHERTVSFEGPSVVIDRLEEALDFMLDGARAYLDQGKPQDGERASSNTADARNRREFGVGLSKVNGE